MAIDGRIEWREYETREGNKRQTHTIVADAVEFLAGPGPADLAAGESPSSSSEDDPGDDDIPF